MRLVIFFAFQIVNQRLRFCNGKQDQNFIVGLPSGSLLPVHLCVIYTIDMSGPPNRRAISSHSPTAASARRVLRPSTPWAFAI